MSIDFQRIRDIFQSVAELPAAERAVVLDRECAGNTELRRRVEALLKAHDDSGELPAVEPLGAKSPVQQEIPADELDPTIGYVQPVEPGLVFAGRYKLREKLGEGGMGVVFVADQIAPVQRRVALKVIRSGLDTRQLLARFEQERQALALMDHPNIAKVFDAGIDEAHRPYFAMELVKGLPLTKYCDEAKLSPRQRIELFIPVCQAVQHAHQKGIIHRDLKPSNILVGLYDGRPVPKVIDFGVAKVTGTRLTDQSVYTEIGSIIGTLEYMSPEQAELNNLDIDTRSDVYALGVILYELLTGTVPFSRKELEKAGLAEMLRVIKEEEPHKPSTKLSSSVKLPSIAASRQTEPKKLTALVKGELDWIVMKALEKDRGRRYETANGLGQDVQRYLTGEPVMAAPASTAYRLRKLIRRNKGPVIAGSMVFAALLIGMAGTTWGLFRADHHRQIADQNADKAIAAAKAQKEAKEQAEANLALATASVEKYLGSVTDDPELKHNDFHKLRKKLLESALPFFQKIAEQKSDDPEVEAGRGRAHHRLAWVRAEMGETDAAIRDYQSMRTIFDKLCMDFPAEQEYRKELAACHHNVASLFSVKGDKKQAEKSFREAASINEVLVRDFPVVPVYRRNLALNFGGIGWEQFYKGNFTEAEALFLQSLHIRETLVNEFPAVPEYRKLLSLSHKERGSLLLRLGKLAEAQASYRQAMVITQKLATDFPADPEYRGWLASDQKSLATSLVHRPGNSPEAEALFHQAIDTEKKLAADFPNVPGYRSGLVATLNNMSLMLSEFGKLTEAEATCRQAMEIAEKLVAEFPASPGFVDLLSATRSTLGIILSKQGRHLDAQVPLRMAFESQEKLAAELPSQLQYAVAAGGGLNNFGDSIRNNGDPEGALEWYEKAAARLTAVVEAAPKMANARNFLCLSHWKRASALDALGRHADAVFDWERALEFDDGTSKVVLSSAIAESRMRMCQKGKDATGCIAAATQFESLMGTDVDGLYNAACYRAVCASVVLEDPKTPAADADRLAKEQADLAMAWLHKAVEAGYDNVEHMKPDADLNALRERDDFKKLLEDLTKAKESKNE